MQTAVCSRIPGTLSLTIEPSEIVLVLQVSQLLLDQLELLVKKFFTVLKILGFIE